MYVCRETKIHEMKRRKRKKIVVGSRNIYNDLRRIESTITLGRANSFFSLSRVSLLVVVLFFVVVVILSFVSPTSNTNKRERE